MIKGQIDEIPNILRLLVLEQAEREREPAYHRPTKLEAEKPVIAIALLQLLLETLVPLLPRPIIVVWCPIWHQEFDSTLGFERKR